MKQSIVLDVLKYQVSRLYNIKNKILNLQNTNINTFLISTSKCIFIIL